MCRRGPDPWADVTGDSFSPSAPVMPLLVTPRPLIPSKSLALVPWPRRGGRAAATWAVDPVDSSLVLAIYYLPIERIDPSGGAPPTDRGSSLLLPPLLLSLYVRQGR